MTLQILTKGLCCSEPDRTGAQEPVQSAYHYLYGRHQLHRYLPGAPRGRYPMETATYADFSGTPTYGPPRRPAQTVEQLVDQGYFTVPNSAPETAILSDRRTTAWLGLDDAIQQIQQRLEIYAQNLYEIKWAECSAINDLFAWEAKYGWPAPSKEQYVLTKRLQALYAEYRAERVSAWRDISRVRQTLPEAAQQYLSAYRKLQILDAGDGP